MLLTLPEVLSAEEVLRARHHLEEAAWTDGRITAGHQSALVKRNLQLPDSDPAARELGELILARLESHPLFLSAALPKAVFPPLFNRYAEGMGFGNHVDNAVRQVPGSPIRIRTDLSATLFLSDPDSYEGGQLIVEDTYGVHEVKLPAGSMVLYPASSLHRVAPVTKGERVASFFWIQSMVRHDAQRTLLFDLDQSIQQVREGDSDHPSLVQLTACYHNLLRMWGEP